MCAILTDETLGSPLERLGAVNTMMLGENGEECLDHTYETFIAQVDLGGHENFFKLALQLKDINCRGSFCWRPWIWQTCTEFGWYQVIASDLMMMMMMMMISKRQQFLCNMYVGVVYLI